MPRIKLKSIEFGQVPFRKMRDIAIPIAERLTLISGHNGIGKSTILGLISNSSGLTHQTSAPRSYFDRLFQANLNEIIFIDYDNEFLSAKEEESVPRPIVTYAINETEELQKRCGLTDRSNSAARIVPRNFNPSTDFVSIDESIRVGPASKVPLPTIYLGLTRVLPIGEAEAKSVYSDPLKSIHDDDKNLMVGFINDVITGVGATPDSVTSNRIKGTSKFSSHPKYGYDSRCVSVGQDSLGSIATALASFQMLQREWKEYPGGLLVIDELDSGLHPHAIRRLVTKLQDTAERLALQIVATTHSPVLIEAIYSSSASKKPKDSVSYLIDTAAPYVMKDAGLQDILNDMELVAPGVAKGASAPKLRVYFEDDEAREIFDQLAPPHVKRQLGKKHGVSIKALSLGVGGDSLANMSSIDPRFQECIFALDADATLKPKHLKHGNVVKLPGAEGKSPERTLFAFVHGLIERRNDHATTWERLREKKISTDQLQTHLLDWLGDLSDRKQAKKWWRDRAKYLNAWNLFKLWMEENPREVARFQSDFEKAVGIVAKRLRRLARLGVVS